MIAATLLGRAEEAYEYWKKIAPAFREEIAHVHRTEPYVYAQMIAGPDAPRYGEAKNSWLTGTAAWNWVAITQHIIGVRPEIAGLRVEPCLPAELDDIAFTRRCRGAEYRVSIKNRATGDPQRNSRSTAQRTKAPWSRTPPPARSWRSPSKCRNDSSAALLGYRRAGHEHSSRPQRPHVHAIGPYHRGRRFAKVVRYGDGER